MNTKGHDMVCESNKDKSHIGLGEFLYGICDGDNNDRESVNKKIENLSYTKHYSLENYVFNPANIFFILKHLDPSDLFLIQIESEISERFPDYRTNADYRTVAFK